MTAIEVVYFDIGSTLVRSAGPGPAKRLATTLGLTDAQRRALDVALMTTSYSGPNDVAASLRQSFGCADDARVADVVQALWQKQLTDAVAMPGAVETVRRIHAAGYRVGLLSNIWEPYLASAAACLGAVFTSFTEPELRLFSCRLGVVKPDATVYRLAIDAAGVPAARIVMVGDSYRRDVAPAIAAGLGAVWVPRADAAGPRERSEGGPGAPERQVASIAEVTAELLTSYGPRYPSGGRR